MTDELMSVGSAEDRRSELNALLNGKTFCCRTHGELMLQHWGDDMWLFRKHPDGQWVSMRKATDDDIAKVAELLTI